MDCAVEFSRDYLQKCIASSDTQRLGSSEQLEEKAYSFAGES